jgi:hypothetical protein
MPFAAKYQEVYNQVYRPVCEANNVECWRVDEIARPGSITKDIVEGIIEADIVLADLTSKNANVFYELGIAHCVGNKTIMTSQSNEDVPFDIASYRVIFYEQSINGSKELTGKLDAAIKELLKSLDQTNNPVQEVLSSRLAIGVKRLQEQTPAKGFEWLHSDAELARIEGKVKGKDIWIISPDLHYDLIKRNFQTLTKRNFKKGITYTYIVPKSEQMQALIPALQKAYESYLDQVKIKQVPEETFRLLAVTHIDIYDPNLSNKEGPRVFLELPIQQRGYWIEVSRDAALGIIGRFKKIVDDESLTYR